MEQLFKLYAGHVALFLEAVSAIVIVIGAIEAIVGLLKPKDLTKPFRRRKMVWLGFGVWLLLGLEFELAADIIRTAIAPSWTEIGQLGAIAVIRTFLNFFLERDVEQYGERNSAEGAPT